MSKGMILELKGEEVIVLTPEGDFRAIKQNKRRKWQIGEEINLPPVHLPEINKKRRMFIPSIALAASILLVFISLFAYPLFGGEQTAIAYVNVDINPSVEMSINKRVQVISMVGLNQAGEEIILKVENWLGKPLGQVTIDLIMAARQQGYLTENQNILVSTSFVDEESESLYVTSIDTALQEAEKKIIDSSEAEKKSVGNQTSDNDNSLSMANIEGQTNVDSSGNKEENIQIHRIKTKKEDHNAAKEKGISPGKYTIYLKAIDEGVEIELDEITSSSIAELAQRLNGVGSILSNKPSKKDEKQENKADKKEQSEQKKQDQQKDKGPKNNNQQNDKAEQNKKDQKEDQKKDQNQGEDDKEKGKSNKPENPGQPGIPSPPTKGQQDKIEQIVDEVENQVEEFKRQLDLQLPNIPGILREVPGFRNQQEKKNNGANKKGNNEGKKEDKEDKKNKGNSNKGNSKGKN